MASAEIAVGVVLPASGTGDRFSCQTPKQFACLLDKPIFFHTVMAFYRFDWIQNIVIIVSTEYIDRVTAMVDCFKDKVKVVLGSNTRHRSIREGIQALLHVQPVPDVVVIHDVVRPFVDEEVVKTIVKNAFVYGAAGVTRPLVSTVIQGDENDMLTASLDRNLYRASEMPQAFKYGVIKEAYEKADENDLNFGTECLFLALKHCQTPAKLIPGPDSLWKITYKKDLYAAEGIMKETGICVCIQSVTGSASETVLQCLEHHISEKGLSCKRVSEVSSDFNTYVFVHTEKSDITTMLETMSQEVCDCHRRNKYEIVKPCVIHVYAGNLWDTETEREFRETIAKLSKDQCSVLWYGVVCQNTCGRLGKMLASLCWTREDSFSGQTFVLHS
ncbi:D-ribitol-5-phosphate cytidylyltransferase-like [Dreissena polymorpha]|uniref:D-ribitol-5-phosphate cytidylyltransferase n=1 Tax=Dreissena polymorpha TaxID=45954 RepID=A0A9D3YNP5_DREPO|nr:D-ribitol-5-phosphate cytidylyltransferase-like [Dreissena polymorpha]XP_052252994.1 D-ribitol-5-phosphate cytidylyltransferase-like [Dreissena polymorpha]XP_052252995.1 D-ribitol-5-phosphate cytidylyltransferase-like [Dreissena polymorpha]XP_052252997.1 D-ribitol-5-phosphate cytidylyltransferase-like [Dreissena polymorpha]XP_052252998.1 D-ribitol-5-phosphate cytidylyltransferase-like [Dreissena polymorpha]KAH3704167.1 hypothetical protein DPMN_079223 [Dreissena polymorpha]